jgi:hypothetical protein
MRGQTQKVAMEVVNNIGLARTLRGALRVRRQRRRRDAPARVA